MHLKIFIELNLLIKIVKIIMLIIFIGQVKLDADIFKERMLEYLEYDGE
jgi:hypothetical protein